MSWYSLYKTPKQAGKEYCEKCGKELKLILSNKFDRKTGKRLYCWDDCHVHDCLHDDHILSWTGKCKRCGEYFDSLTR